MSIGNKVACPYCEFHASAPDSMRVHFAMRHPGADAEMPSETSWIIAKEFRQIREAEDKEES